LRWYINGAPAGSDAFAEIPTPSTQAVQIGSRFGSSDFFNGLIDDVAIFSVALTESDIEDIVTKGLSDALGMTAVSPSGKLVTTWSKIKK